MKKIVLLLVMLIMTLCVFANGETEEGTTATDEPVTITLFHTYGEGSKKAARDNWFEEFDMRFPNIILERTRFKLSQNHQKLLTSVAAGTPPDLVSNHYYYFSRYAEQNLLEPLESYFAKNGENPEDIFYAPILEMAKYDGTMYSVPQFSYARALLYNKDLMAQAGLDPEAPPANWNEMIDMAQKMTVWKDGNLEISGFQPPRPDETEHMVNYFIMLVWQQGGDIFSDDLSEATLATPEGIKALQFYSDFFNTLDTCTVNYGVGAVSAQKPFIREKSGMVIGANFDLVFIKQTNENINFGATLIPAPEGGEEVSFIDSFNLAMLSSSKNKETAWKLLEFTASKEQQKDFAVLSSNFPARMDAAQDPVFSSTESLVALSKAVDVGRSIPSIPQWTEVKDTLAIALESVLIGQSDVETALEKAENEINKNIL